MHVDNPVHWTIVCLVPPGFWPSEETYATCLSPALRSQSAYYVAKALVEVAARWTAILGEVDLLVDSNVLQQYDTLQDILVDDDAFSTSKRYFWAINLMHEAISLLDDAIQQWVSYQKRAVTPFKLDPTTIQEHWREKAQEVLVTAERHAEEACEELKLLRQKFEEKLVRVTVMRDGVSLTPSNRDV